MTTLLEILALSLVIQNMNRHKILQGKYAILLNVILIISLLTNTDMLTWIVFFILFVYSFYVFFDKEFSKRVDEEYEKCISGHSAVSSDKKENREYKKTEKNVQKYPR